MFLTDGSAFFVSVHADPATDYPCFWGHADETGESAGEGTPMNLPLPRGTAAPGNLAALDIALDAIGRFANGLLVVSFGADTFEEDPISHFTLTRGDCGVTAACIEALGLPTVTVMEGGYAVADLPHNIDAFLNAFARR